MTLFAVPILILLLIAIIIMLLFRRYRESAFVVLLFLVLNYCWQVYPVHIGRSSEDENIFRIVSFNIYPQVDSTQYDAWQRQMIHEIKQLNPDILCLQEFRYKEMVWLEKELCNFYSYTEEMNDQRKIIKWRIYSRYKMSNISRYKPSEIMDTTGLSNMFISSINKHQIRQPFYSANVHFSDRDSITIISCHLQSNGYSKIRRSLLENESWFRRFCQYYKAIESASKIRFWEAQNLRHVLDSIGNNHPIIVVGDLNDFNRSKCLNTIQGCTLEDAWWKGGNGLGITYSGFGFHLRLDHILFNNRLSLHNVRIGTSVLSDHRPLIADFTIN